MENLSAFLAQNVIKDTATEYAPSKRFVDKNGEPIKWKIAPITSQEDEALRKSCRMRVGKRGQQTIETDTDKYVGLLAVKCTAYPDLNNKELQDSYGVMGADQLLKTMLKPGEYMDYLEKVQEVNGFDVEETELIEQVKN